MTLPQAPALSVVLFTGLLASSAAAGTTWHVDGTNPNCPGTGTPADPFCTIALAVAAAAPGDTILAAPGTYHESVGLDRNGLTLAGSGPDVTTIVGQPSSPVVGPTGFPVLALQFAIRGFRITSSDPGPGAVYGVNVDPASASPIEWSIRDCVIDGCDVGVRVSNAFGGSVVIENCLITDCGIGVDILGTGVVVRNSTIVGMDRAGIDSTGPCCSQFEVADTIIAYTGWWAVGRTFGGSTNLHHNLVFMTNLDNPPTVQGAGPFMEVLHEGQGFWFPFVPTPGPILQADPLFVDAPGGDHRPTAQSPCIDAGNPAAAPAPGAFDLLGFGHRRLDDGDFDGVERIDIGAVEFGGLLSDGRVAVGEVVTFNQSGVPGAIQGLFLGLAGPGLDLGTPGTFWLDPNGLLLLLALGPLGPTGTASVLSGTVPPQASGLTLHFQAVQQTFSPGEVLHWTNLEVLTVD